MIRTLQSNEADLMVEHGKSFFDEGKIPGRLNPEVFAANWRKYIETGTGVVFAEFGVNGDMHGALGAIFYRDPFNGDPVATEQFWYLSPQFRGRGLLLLDAYMGAARTRGCKRIYMIHLEALQPEVLKAVYERKGFRLLETGYVKEFNNGAAVNAEQKEQS